MSACHSTSFSSLAVADTSSCALFGPLPRLPSSKFVDQFRLYCLKLLLPAPASEVEASVPKEFSAQLKWLYQKAGNHKCAQQPKLPPNRLNMQEWRKRLAGSTLPEEIELLDYLENGKVTRTEFYEFLDLLNILGFQNYGHATETYKLAISGKPQ